MFFSTLKPSVGGYQYIINFIDEYYNWTVILTIRNISKSLGFINMYKEYSEQPTNIFLQKLFLYNFDGAMIRPNYPIKLKSLRSDNGG